MRVMLKVTLDTEAASQAHQSGKLGEIIGQTLDRLKPECSYFGTENGKRTAFIVFDMTDSSQLPALAEPLFAHLKAEVSIQPVMNMEDLKKGLQAASAVATAGAR